MKRVTLSILSVALLAASLALGTQPTQAASTKTSSSRLAGLTRYETAIEVARTYIEARKSIGESPVTAILTSGEDRHFGYPLIAPSLSRRRGAPLLLTEPRELPASVTNFLSTSGIEEVVILGGSHVVTTDVEGTLVDAGYDVSRIAGDDVYATAVAVAERVGPSAAGEPGPYLEQGRTALVATGEVFADALAAGPLAYRGQHPLLLTPPSRLDDGAAQFLADSGTQHVIILGGSAAVGTSVERSIADLGITVDRLSGRDRYATAVRVATELLGPDSPHRCFDGADVGLAFGGRAADALVSGPLLGEWCAPLLLVEQNALPGVVEHFLQFEDFADGGDRDQLHLTAFGGPAAVSSFAVLLAVGAGTLKHIQAQIIGVQGRCYLDVAFEEFVRTSDAENIRNYARSGDALNESLGTVDAGDRKSTRAARIILTGSVEHMTSVVPVGCKHPLETDEQIEVAAESIKGESGRRNVRRSVSYVEADRVRPRLTLTVDDAATEVVVTASEPVRLRTGVAEIRREASPRKTAEVALQVAEGSTRFTIPAPHELGGVLRAGDFVIITWGALEDLAGNQNSQITARAAGDNTPPEVSRVSASRPRGRAGASVSVGGLADGSAVANALTISTQRYGQVFGAIGNDWSVEFRQESSWPATRRTELTIAPAQQGGQLTVRAAEGRTLKDLASDLNSHLDFKQLFRAELAADVDDGATLAGSTAPTRLQGGTSTVDLVVRWSEPVHDCDAGSDAIDLSRLVLDIDADNQVDLALDGNGAGRFGLTFVDAPDGLAAIMAGRAACDTTAGVRAGTLVARLQSSDHSALPSLQSRLLVRAGAAVDLNGNRTQEHRIDSFSRS